MSVSLNVGRHVVKNIQNSYPRAKANSRVRPNTEVQNNVHRERSLTRKLNNTTIQFFLQIFRSVRPAEVRYGGGATVTMTKPAIRK